MHSFIDLDRTFSGQPRDLGPVLARIDVGKGQQRLFEHQAPELLKQLSESARIASITASNAIEGVIVSAARAEKIAEGSPRFRNRNEREFAGYRDAVDELMRLTDYKPLSVPLLLHLHRQLFHYVDGRGGYLKTDQNLIVSYENGRREVVFTPTHPANTEFELSELIVRYNEAKRESRAHPLLLIAGLILDLLAIHPVADGNGRLARLITTYELLSQGYAVARYVSIEQRFFESKNSYYASLYESQRDWHGGKHDIWPWVSYLVRVIADAYSDFERKVSTSTEHTQSKQELAREYILNQAPQAFKTRDVERALPYLSSATIRLVLNELRDAKIIKSEGWGPGARWHRF